MNVCQRSECQSTAGCAYRGPRGEFCYFAGRFTEPSTIPLKIVGHKDCPYCLGTGKVTMIEMTAAALTPADGKTP